MRQVAGKLAMMVVGLMMSYPALAQQPGVHYYHQGVMPPGAIGSQQLQRGGPLPGYYQPVEILAPSGAAISLAIDGQFEESRKGLRKAGLLVGSVYRLRVTDIPLAEGQEVFPTIEIIDRLYTPLGQEHRFSIPVELSNEDLKLALAGKFVTRVIYVEDPRNALPVRDDPKQQTWFEAAPSQDPLAVADSLGRPIAILRLGGRVPDASTGPDPQFFFGAPPFVDYPNAPAVVEKPMPAKETNTLPKSEKKEVKTAAKAQNSTLVRTSFDAGASGNCVPTPERGNEELKRDKEELKTWFSFKEKTSAKPDGKILSSPNSTKTPAISEPSAKEGPQS